MEQPVIREQEDGRREESQLDNRALEFVEKQRVFYDHYARGRIKLEPAPAGMNTFAFNLETNTIYIHPRFYEELGFSEEKTSFATLHEIEHFLEKIRMLAEKDGDHKFARYLENIKKSKAWSLMDNCVADIRENRAVGLKTNQSFRDIEQACYKEDLFKETDFTSEPKHIQFCYALLREARVPGETCTVAPEVREKLDVLGKIKGKSGKGLVDIMTRPNVPMSERLEVQEKYIWPMVEELLKKDIEEQKNKKDKPKDAKREGEGQKGEPGGENEPGDPGDPNEIFKDAYAEADKKVPNAVSVEKNEKALKEWQKAHGKNPLDAADQEYAKKLGVKKEQLQQYREIVAELNTIKNPETNLSLAQELRELIQRIISRRLRPAVTPRHPVEEGEELVDPSELVSQVKAGNLEPKAWQTEEVREKKGKKFGEVEITLVCDRSGSMADDRKLEEQRKAGVLMMEALKEFAEAAEAERVNLEKPLEVRSEIYTFQATPADAIPVKKMSAELSEKERIETAGVLSTAPGQRTTDYVSLEAILAGLTPEIKQKVAAGELKKIVIVFTDGQSHGAQEVKNALEKLRGAGVVAVGIGITEAGRPALETYAPDARLAETAEKLPLILGDLLKEHLADI